VKESNQAFFREQMIVGTVPCSSVHRHDPRDLQTDSQVKII